MLGTELKLLTLKSQKKSPWAHSTNSAGFRHNLIPALLWGTLECRDSHALLCLPLPGSQIGEGMSLPLKTDGLAKLWREPAQGSRGFQRELDKSQGEFPLKNTIPCHRASQAKLITMVSKVLLVPESEHPPKLLSYNMSFSTPSALFISLLPHPHISFFLLAPNQARCWLVDISTADSRREESKADFPDLLNVSAWQKHHMAALSNTAPAAPFQEYNRGGTEFCSGDQSP